MPFKANADRRHHIPRQQHKVTNWAEYDAALCQRGSLTVWFTDAAIAAWRAEPRTTPAKCAHRVADPAESLATGVYHPPRRRNVAHERFACASS